MIGFALFSPHRPYWILLLTLLCTPQTTLTTLSADEPPADPPQVSGERLSALNPPRVRYELRGTEDRNNPLRRSLNTPFTGEQLFVHFRLRYAGESIDLPPATSDEQRNSDAPRDDGEFVVLWLDEVEGNDASTHSGGVPNVGIHVHQGENRFMVRFGSGAESFTKATLVGDRDFWIVARLWKSVEGVERPFDRLDVWVDPTASEERRPHASVSSARSISKVAWAGFSTGRKTEFDDRIFVTPPALAIEWRQLARHADDWEIESSPNQPTRPVKTIDFVADVAPILSRRCFACHGGSEPVADRRLDVLDEILSLVAPGAADRSPLFQRIISDDPDLRMPPPAEHDKLPAAEIDVLRRWIDEGVEWDESRFPTPVPETDHWAFQPIERPDVPDVAIDPRWRDNPIDRFVAARHHQLGLRPSPPADAATLRHRVSIDLTGLLPLAHREATQQQTGDAAEVAPEASLDQWIEQLLESPAYGERWARHWMDVARYGDSNGYQHNRARPHAWRYRDYLVKAFQEHQSYDQFLRQQIAGDATDSGIAATGFLAAARYSGNELDKTIQRNDILVDVTNTVSKVVLGLTMECAQCHTHKFDPITIRDYYRFQAFFAGGQPGNVVLAGADGGADLRQAAEWSARRWEIFDRTQMRLVRNRRRRGYPEPILITPKSVVAGMTAADRTEFQTLEKKLSALPQAWSWVNLELPNPVAPHEMRWPLPRLTQPATVRILGRGEVQSPGPEVHPGSPLALSPVFATVRPVTASRAKDGGDELDASELGPGTDGQGPKPRGREDLVQWMLDRRNPLTARVWVNRIWQRHFGRGLVETSGDFGTQGTPPTHPLLLDWLAVELIESGWDTQHIQRLILRSQTYRQASLPNSDNEQIDAENRFLWRHRPRRVEAECIRDNMLLLSGNLDRTIGGPPVPVARALDSHRRSLYLEQKRDHPPAFAELFDAPGGLVSCTRRRASTVPLQSLYMFNSPLMDRVSRAWADKLLGESPDVDGQVRRAIGEAFSRAATDAEATMASQFVREHHLRDFCSVLLNTNEFMYTK